MDVARAARGFDPRSLLHPLADVAYHRPYDRPRREASRLNAARLRLALDSVASVFDGSHPDVEQAWGSLVDQRRRGLREVPALAVEPVAEDERPPLPGLDPSRLAEAGWREWLPAFFPRRFSKPFSPYHCDFWEWAWAMKLGVRPRPFVGDWPRGGGKSESGETCMAEVGARRCRRYGAYVCEIQPQADKRVGNVSRLLESPSFAAYYPDVAARAVTKYGSSRGWRRNRLVTRSGFVVDAMGLDSASRGLKEDDARPDFVIFDDIDNRHDNATATARKIEIITDTILPMTTDDAAIVVLQNTIIADGLMARLVDGRADFLVDRIVSGPIPAVRGLKTTRVEGEDGIVRNVITAGEPTWEGQDLAACQAKINTYSLASFLREQQHEVSAPVGALWRAEDIRRVSNVPPAFKRIVVGVDPSGGVAEAGIVCVGQTADGRIYVLDDSSQPGNLGPENWARAVGEVYRRRQANAAVAEKNFGGDMVASTIRGHAGSAVHVVVTSSSRGKDIRAEPVVAAYQRGQVLHCGTFPELEREMTQWVPGKGRSPNRVDGLVFACVSLLDPPQTVQSSASARPPGY